MTLYLVSLRVLSWVTPPQIVEPQCAFFVDSKKVDFLISIGQACSRVDGAFGEQAPETAIRRLAVVNWCVVMRWFVASGATSFGAVYGASI